MNNNLKITDIDSEDIKKVMEDELREKVLDISKEQSGYIKNLALVEIIRLGLELRNYYNENANLLFYLEKDGEKITDLYTKIYNVIFEGINNESQQELSSNLGIDYFLLFRDEIESLLIGISGYITEISYIHEFSREIIHRDEVYKAYGQVIDNIDTSKLYQQIYSFLIEDMNTLPQKLVEIVSVIPLKITRKKYYDLVKSAIIRNLKGSSVDKVNLYIERYKYIFNGSLEPHYGQKFDYFFRKTHELKQLNMESITLIETKEIFNKSVEALSEVNCIINLITQIGLIVNRYIVLKILKSKTYGWNCNGIDSLFHSWNKYRKNTKSDIEKKIYTLCERKINELENKLKKINLKLENLVEEIYSYEGLLNKTLNNELSRIQEALTYLSDAYIEKKELLFCNSDVAASESYIEESVNSFIDYLDRNINNMSNKERKVRMRRLLCLIDNPFKSPDDFFNYMRASLETSKSKEELIVNANLVAEVISNYRK